MIELVLVFYVSKKGAVNNTNKAFDNCNVLANSCNNQECRYNFLCNKEENQNCNVYDCGKEYGVKITEMSGNVVERMRQKPNQIKIQEMVNRCQGLLQILDKKECENEKAVARVRVETSEECIVNSFTMKIKYKCTYR